MKRLLYITLAVAGLVLSSAAASENTASAETVGAMNPADGVAPSFAQGFRALELATSACAIVFPNCVLGEMINEDEPVPAGAQNVVLPASVWTVRFEQDLRNPQRTPVPADRALDPSNSLVRLWSRPW